MQMADKGLGRDIERRKPDEIEQWSDRLARRGFEWLDKVEEQGLANVEEPDLEGWDLHRAAKVNRADIARALIDRGAEVDARAENGDTPLHVAARKNSLEVARLLIDRGANTDGIDLDWIESQ